MEEHDFCRKVILSSVIIICTLVMIIALFASTLLSSASIVDSLSLSHDNLADEVIEVIIHSEPEISEDLDGELEIPCGSMAEYRPIHLDLHYAARKRPQLPLDYIGVHCARKRY